MASRKKKKSKGCLISLLIFLSVTIVLIIGGSFLLKNLKGKATKVVAKKVIEEQIKSNSDFSNESNIDASEIIDNISEEDIDKVSDIVDKYVGWENVGDYVDMIKDGNVSEMKQYMNENISDADKAEIQELYEKYSNLIGE